MNKISCLLISCVFLGMVWIRGVQAQNSDTKIMSLGLTIEPGLSLQVQGTGEKLIFGQEDIQRGEISKSIQVKINSNTGTPYKVYMIPLGSFVNEQGLDLPAEYMSFNIADLKKGKSEVTQPTAIPDTETLIYSSDAEGDSQTFTILFNLKATNQLVPAGKFNVNFKFRLESE